MTVDMQVTIDYAYFPHIVDAIVCFASPRALLQLRGTCKSIRSMCDRRLLVHSRAGSVRDTLTSYPDEGSSHRPENLQDVVSHVRILDVGGEIQCGPPMIDDKDEKCLRIIFLPWWMSTLRVMPSLAADSAWSAHSHRLTFRRVILFISSDTPSGMRWTCATATERLVINILSLSVTASSIIITMKRITEAQIVVVLHPPALDADKIYFLQDLLHRIVAHTAGRASSYTIVGLPPDNPLLTEGIVWDEVDREPKPAEKAAVALTGRDPTWYHISWDEFRSKSPNVALETDVDYRMTLEEREAVVTGDLVAIKALGL